MEDENEAAALKKEIEFLTNLINGAGSTSVTHVNRPANRPDFAPTRHHAHWSAVTQTRHSLVKPTPATSSKYSLTRVPTSKLHNNNTTHTHNSGSRGEGLPRTSQVYVKNNVNPSLSKSGAPLESAQKNKTVPYVSVSTSKDKNADNARTCIKPVQSATLQKATSKTESSTPRRTVKIQSVGSLGNRNVQTQHVSNAIPSTSVKRTVCPKNSEPSTFIKRTASPTNSEPSTPKRTVCPTNSESSTTSVKRTVHPSNSEPSTSVKRTVHPSNSDPSTSPKRTVRPTNSEPSTSVKRTVQPSNSDPSTSVKRTVYPSNSDPSTSVKRTVYPSNSDPSTSVKRTVQPSNSDPSTSPKRTVYPSNSDPSTSVKRTVHPSNSEPSTSVKRTVHPKNSDIQKIAHSTKTPEVRKGQLVRSVSDTCLQSMASVVIPSHTQLKRSATTLTLATSTKPKPTKHAAPISNAMMSPTVIKAGKKIIEEIELLNRAMTQLERCSQRNTTGGKSKSSRVPVEIAKPLPTTKVLKSNTSVPSGKYSERTVLPLGSTGQFAVTQPKEYSSTSVNNALIKRDKYKLVNTTVTQRLSPSTSAPAVLQSETKTASDRVVLPLAMDGKSKKTHSVQTGSASVKLNQPSIPVKEKSPYKLVRTSPGPKTQLQASSLAPCDRHVTRSITMSPFKLTRVSTPQKNKYKLTRRNSLSGGGKRSIAHTPVASPRRRVYLTRRRLQNMPITLKPVTKPATMATKEQPVAAGKPICTNSSSTLKPQIRRRSTVKSGQSDEVKSLLLELAIIDTAFKSAKLQSSQKLLKRALLTKQKMMQKKRAEKNMVTSPITASRHSQVKWATPAGRRPRLRSHSRSKSPSKGHKSWNSRFSLKKTGPDTDLSLNQLLGRTVDNASSNKYKFINRGASSKSTPRKYTHRSPRYLHSNKNRLKVDRRTPAQRAIDESNRQTHRRRRVGRQHVSIGGVVYKTSQRKLTRASPKRVVSKKGFPKPQTRTVSVGGHRYRVTQNRLTLLRVNSDKDGVKRLSLGGVKYIQTKPGTLVRAADTTSRTTASRFIYRSIATAAAAAVARNKKVSGTKKYCMFYNRFGKCNRGDKCPYLHDPDKVAVCTRFLRGTCKVTDCPFSHKVEPDKMPVCTHFLRGVCSRDECPYRHVKVSSDAELCQDFVNGYCPLGDKCKKKHSRVCPKHDGKGSCPEGTKCKLFHPRRGEKRPVESEHRPAVRKPRIKTAEPISSKDVEMQVTEDEDINLPLCERRLPSYISIRSEESAMDVSISAPGDTSFSVDEPLQIRPNLSFDTS